MDGKHPPLDPKIAVCTCMVHGSHSKSLEASAYSHMDICNTGLVDVVYKQLSCLDLGPQAIYAVDNRPPPPPPQGGDKFQEIASNSLSKLVHSFSHDILTYSTIVVNQELSHASTMCVVLVFSLSGSPPPTFICCLVHMLGEQGQYHKSLKND